jgi:DNA-binding phage protein
VNRCVGKWKEQHRRLLKKEIIGEVEPSPAIAIGHAACSPHYGGPAIAKNLNPGRSGPFKLRLDNVSYIEDTDDSEVDMKLVAIKKAAREFGLLKLSKETGLARSYLYKVIEGESSPTLDAFAKITAVLGFEVELRRIPMEDSVEVVSELVAQGGDWKIHFFNFVDAFRRTKSKKLIEKPPVKALGARERSLIASITHQLCLEMSIEVPKWVMATRPLKDPWFVSGMENLKAMAVAESPITFKRNNVFVLENFLARA